MKQVINVLAVLFVSVLSSATYAQSGSNNFIPELVFQNPVLIAGEAGKNGAIYKFSNVAAGTDATVTLKGRSSGAVTLTNIDVADMGFTKAFQPQLGIAGNVPANQDWWMDFEMCFLKAGTTDKQKIKEFKVTAIDVDGDGVSIREYVQMNKVKAVAYCPVNYLTEATTDVSFALIDADNDNAAGVDKKAVGPVWNYTNIDTLGTPVMSTYTYEDKSVITFRYGAKSGSIISNAGERLNSLWFKAFQLTPPSLLPVAFYSFAATYDKKGVQLTWSADTKDISGNFVVEKSTDGKSFTSVATIAASVSSLSSYQHKDENVSSATGVVYYRIVAKEKTGEVKYSSIKVVRLSKEITTNLAIYPNPVQTTANLTLPNNWQNKPVLVSIFNSAGMQVQTINIKAASQTETLNFQHLSKGIYVVKATCEGVVAEQRIAKY
ncbi:MAG TPA: T9SS type A sorting domain-containing protein [Flavisolibacter sp.]|nr:T9SS type A sorting domain-containing protein [Flavisolibacter sp.]